ncbi:MAG: hypothetical protein D6824_02490, partial [Planctomycetota bacterium]
MSEKHLLRSAGLARRPVFVTALVASLASTTVAGCASSWESSSSQFRGAFNPGSLAAAAGQATAQIDPNDAAPKYDPSWFEAKAREVSLPQTWLSEARMALADIEARRAAAQAAAVERDARMSKQLAFADAELTSAYKKEEAELADAEKLRDVFDARLNQMSMFAEAQAEA